MVGTSILGSWNSHYHSRIFTTSSTTERTSVLIRCVNATIDRRLRGRCYSCCSWIYHHHSCLECVGVNYQDTSRVWDNDQVGYNASVFFKARPQTVLHFWNWIFQYIPLVFTLSWFILRMWWINANHHVSSSNPDFGQWIMIVALRMVWSTTTMSHPVP